METLNYSEVREERWAEAMERVCQNHEPMVVTRRDGRPVVMLSLEDYEALAERTREPAPLQAVGQ